MARVFTGKCNISQSGSGSGFWQVSVSSFNDPGGYDATEIAVGDFLIFSDNNELYSLPITQVISAVGGSASIRVSNVGITTISSVPTTTGAAISRGTVNHELFPIVANVGTSNAQLYSEITFAKIDELLGSGSGDGNGIYDGSGDVLDGTIAESEDSGSLRFGVLTEYEINVGDGFKGTGFFNEVATNEGFIGVNQEGYGVITSYNTVTGANSHILATASNSIIGSNSTARLAIGVTSMFTDNRVSKQGIVYSDDYSSDFVNLSLVHKKYVDDAIGAITGDGDGVYDGSGDIPDGTLATLASHGTFAFQYSTDNPAIQISSDALFTKIWGGDGLANFEASSGRLRLVTDEYIFNVEDASGAVFTDSSIAPGGIRYFADYSLGFSDRSLVDKGYVDSAILAGIPVFPAGAVIFSDGSQLSQDQFSFFWDSSSSRLGIGTNTPSSKLEVTQNGFGVTQSNTYGITLANNTAAAAGAQQMSPGIRWRGFGWKTAATAASQSVDFLADMLPGQGSTAPIGTWRLLSSINGAAYNTAMTVTSAGNITTPGNIDATGSISTAGGVVVSAGASTFGTSAASTTTLNVSGTAKTIASGTGRGLDVTVAFQPTTGAGVYNFLQLTSTINQTGSSSGITRGLYLAPTLTSAVDYRAIETTQGSLTMADTYLNTGSAARSLFNLTQTWNTSGNPTAIFLNVTNTASGATANLIDLQISGTSQFKVTKAGGLSVSSAGFIGFSSRGRVQSPADSIIRLSNAGEDNFDRLQFGGGTSSFPALKRNSAALEARLADDSATAGLIASYINLDKTITAGGTTGDQTINNASGSVNFAGGALSFLTVTNSLVSTSSVILATVATNDATMKSVQVVAGSGFFRIYFDNSPSNETRVNFLVLN